MISLITGLAAGGLHVFAGPDHLAGLTPIAVRDPARAGRTGANWGFGHGLGVVAVGAIGLMLRSLIDFDVWSAWAEFLVGFMLIGVGAWSVIRAPTVQMHVHSHDHGQGVHQHAHAHPAKRLNHSHAALGVGFLHGMAGSGHLFGVLPALALPTGLAVVYLGSYLVAAVVAMGGFAYLLGVLLRKGGQEWMRRIMVVSGSLAIVVGVFWIIGSWPA